MKKELFQLKTTLAEQLGNICAKQLGKESKKSKKTIFVNLSMVRLQTCFFLPKLVYAKGISEQTGTDITVIVWKSNKKLKELLDKMGIRLLSLERILIKNIFFAIKAFFVTIGLFIYKCTGDDLKHLSALGLPIGYPIYEDILRNSDLSTIRSIRNITCTKKIFHILWMLYAVDAYLKQHPPLYFVVDDLAYHEGALIQLFNRHGAHIYNSSWEGEECISFQNNGQIIRRGEMSNMLIKKYMGFLKEDVSIQADQLIHERFSGKSGRDIDRQAFKGKKVMKRDEFQKYLGLNPNKKNVIIMAHTFTDAVFNYGDLYYRDYYDWLEQTLCIAEKISTVNWILKPHPSRKLYHESKDSIEDMYNRHKNKNLFFLDDSISTETLINVADIIVTIGSNAGGEFSCFGIPTVMIGTAYYSGFGFTIEPKTREEYEEQLRNIALINRLSIEQTTLAKRVFYLRFSGEYNEKQYNDDFSSLILDSYNHFSEEQRSRLFENDDKAEEMNDRITENIIDYLKSHNLKECEYFKRGLKSGKMFLKE